ncbi:unnamed protein product, partial [Chrysoparadoxa australica]
MGRWLLFSGLAVSTSALLHSTRPCLGGHQGFSYFSNHASLRHSCGGRKASESLRLSSFEDYGDFEGDFEVVSEGSDQGGSSTAGPGDRRRSG